jgi:hypothetical protein
MVGEIVLSANFARVHRAASDTDTQSIFSRQDAQRLIEGAYKICRLNNPAI